MGDTAREKRVRRALRRQRHYLQKSRVRNPHLDDLGGYRIINRNNCIVAGPRFDLTIDEAEEIAGGGFVVRTQCSSGKTTWS